VRIVHVALPDVLVRAMQTICELVASGSVMSVDPDRVIVKKIILSGVPVKVKNRYAVVKQMFYFPEDVKVLVCVLCCILSGRLRWCFFGCAVVQASGGVDEVWSHWKDTVCMSLYKRVFPKWGPAYKPLTAHAEDREHAC
jgi:pre-rRNA-processing protein TSR1